MSIGNFRSSDLLEQLSWPFWGTMLNMVTVLVVESSAFIYKRPLTIQNRMMLNLCFNNIIFCTYVLPMYIYDLYRNIHSSWGKFCRFQVFIYIFIPCNNILAYLHITLHRYFAIVFVFNVYRPSYGNCRKTCSIIAISTLLVVIIMLPAMLQVWGSFGRSSVSGTCKLLLSGRSRGFHQFGQTLAIVLPLITMIYCYSHILYTVRRQRTRIQASLPVNTDAKSNDTCLTVASVCIVLVFFVCFMPTMLAEQIPSLRDVVVVQALAGVLAYTHAITDPLIYVFFDRKLKKDLKKMFRRLSCRTGVPSFSALPLTSLDPVTGSQKGTQQSPIQVL